MAAGRRDGRAHQRRVRIVRGRQRGPDEPAGPVVKEFGVGLFGERAADVGAARRRRRNAPEIARARRTIRGERRDVADGAPEARARPPRRALRARRTAPAASPARPCAAPPTARRLRGGTRSTAPSALAAISAMRAAAAAGRCAAADTSADEPMAAAMALRAVASSRLSTSTVSSVSARGSVLSVTSVMAASVPQEPARSLQRS